jgi:hypothetical protein
VNHLRVTFKSASSRKNYKERLIDTEGFSGQSAIINLQSLINGGVVNEIKPDDEKNGDAMYRCIISHQ